MLLGLLWLTSIVVHELYSKVLLLFNVLYSLIPPLEFNKQNKNHKEVCFVGNPLVFIFLFILTLWFF